MQSTDNIFRQVGPGWCLTEGRDAVHIVIVSPTEASVRNQLGLCLGSRGELAVLLQHRSSRHVACMLITKPSAGARGGLSPSLVEILKPESVISVELAAYPFTTTYMVTHGCCQATRVQILLYHLLTSSLTLGHPLNSGASVFSSVKRDWGGTPLAC